MKSIPTHLKLLIWIEIIILVADVYGLAVSIIHGESSVKGWACTTIILFMALIIQVIAFRRNSTRIQ